MHPYYFFFCFFFCDTDKNGNIIYICEGDPSIIVIDNFCERGEERNNLVLNSFTLMPLVRLIMNLILNNCIIIIIIIRMFFYNIDKLRPVYLKGDIIVNIVRAHYKNGN